MRTFNLKSLLFIFLTFFILPISNVADLKVSDMDQDWEAKRTLLKGKCTRHVGEGFSPQVKVSNIPARTVKLELYFTDRQ
ncbi:MAG: hypothetical protein CMF70_05260 [Magnetovibrio sp.]|nr:hypothetical protein [Magnetovibrio sp.]